MSKNGPASMSTRQITELHAAVLRALPEMTSDVAQSWIENPRGLAKTLCEALMPPSREPIVEMITVAGYEFQQTNRPDGLRTIELGDFEIDYHEPLSDKLAANKFDWVNEDITDEHYPFEQKGKKKLTLSLVNLGDGDYPTSQVEAAIKRLKAVSSDLAAQLDVAKRFPNLQRELYIVALGSRWRSPRDNVLAPVLYGPYVKRALYLYRYDGGWDDDCWFLAAR